MLTLYDLKPRFQAVLRPAVARLVAAGITANAVTLSAAGISLAYGGALLAWPRAPALLLGLPLVLLLRMALNAVDGMIAREHGQASRLGALLNEGGDLVSDAALYLPLALALPLPAWSIVLAVVLALIGEAIGIAAVLVGSDRRYDGPMGKSDRAAVFGALALAAGLGVPAASTWMPVAVGIVVLLSLVTIWNRGRAALRATA